MRKKLIGQITLIGGILVGILVVSRAINVLAALPPPSDLSGFAWSASKRSASDATTPANAQNEIGGLGWFSFNCDSAGLCDAGEPGWKVSRDAQGNLTGYAWSSTLGYVKFNPGPDSDTGKYTAGGYPASPGQDAKLQASNSVTGWARACAIFLNGCSGPVRQFTGGWDGWISLSGTASNGQRYGVAYDETGHKFTGYAWAGVLGAINFDPGFGGVTDITVGSPSCSNAFDVSINSIATQTMTVGTSISVPVTVAFNKAATIDSFSLNVSSGLTASFAPATCSAGAGGTCNTTMTIIASPSASTGAQTATLSANGAGACQTSTQFTINVNGGAPDVFQFNASPTNPPDVLAGNQTVSGFVNIQRIAGTPDSVRLTWLASDPGDTLPVTPVFVGSICTPQDTCQMQIKFTVPPGTPSGSYVGKFKLHSDTSVPSDVFVDMTLNVIAAANNDFVLKHIPYAEEAPCRGTPSPCTVHHPHHLSDINMPTGDSDSGTTILVIEPSAGATPTTIGDVTLSVVSIQRDNLPIPAGNPPHGGALCDDGRDACQGDGVGDGPSANVPLSDFSKFIFGNQLGPTITVHPASFGSISFSVEKTSNIQDGRYVIRLKATRITAPVKTATTDVILVVGANTPGFSEGGN